MRRIDKDVEKQVVNAYLSEPCGGQVLATRFGIGSTTLYRVLRRNGVPIADEKRNGRAVRRYALTEEQELRVVESYRLGQRSKPLAKQFGCSRETVLAILKRHGASGVTGRPKREVASEELNQAAALAGKGLAQAEIATRLGVSQGTVSGWLRMMGIARRPQASGKAHVSWRGGRYVNNQGYVLVYLGSDDPMMAMSHSSGYVLEHRVVMARHLGRPLTQSETVHHVNNQRTDNRIENLELRVGKHGKGVRMVCSDCGSHNVKAVSLK